MIDQAALQRELEEYLRRPENQKMLQEEQERKTGRACKRRIHRIGLELAKCDQPTQLLLGPIWRNPTITSLLNGLLVEGEAYGPTFEERLYNPRVRGLLERAAQLHLEKKDPDLKNLLEDWVHHLINVQEKEAETKPKPTLDSHSLLQYVNSASSCKAQGNKAYKEKRYEEAFKAYTSGATVLSSIQPNPRDKKLVDDILLALYRNQAAAGLHVGELGTVLKACNRVLEEDPYDVKALYRRGMVYYRRNQTEDAKKDWVQALRLEPDSEDVKKMLQRLEEDREKAEETRRRMARGITAKAEPSPSPKSAAAPVAAQPLPVRVVVLSLYGTLVQIGKKLTPSPLLALLEDAQVDQLKATVDHLLATDLPTAAAVAEAVPGVTAAMAAKFTAGVEHEVASVELLPGTREALAALRQAGYALGLCANALSPYARVLDTLRLRDAFDHVLLSCDVGLVKPHPGVYHLTLERFAVRPGEVVWCGDHRLADVVGPEKLGIKSLVFDANRFPNGAAAVCAHLNVALPET